MLLYADHNESLKIAVFVRGKSTDGLPESEKARIQSAQTVYSRLAEKAQLPFISIVFDDTIETISEVYLESSTAGGPIGNSISLQALTDVFKQAGLPAPNSSPDKAINKHASSAYHEWQRASLGNIKVTDVDLIRIDGARSLEVVELKRSYYSLDRWQPFRDDFTNFNLLEAFCERISAGLTIIYNQRITNPFSDDASRVSAFSYSSRGGASAIGVLRFEEFVSGKY